ncbi:MAG TPA: WbqC family protein [Ohtaekwangia sp.]|uniref:WbqC family protein n=1 Tax=Ohtaekwangia sp. TaxID=2066019 RepID=UPI002F953A67
MNALIELHYLPSIAYFSVLSSSNEIIVERYEHYVKQTYRNRCYLNTSQGPAHLTIPLSGKHNKVVITDIRMDYTQKWLNNHWRTVQSAYGNAPFFEHYAEDLEKLLFKKYEFLYDLNFHLLSMCLAWLRWNTPVRESMSYEKDTTSGIQDMRSLINPKKTDLLAKFYSPVTYTQVFGNAFVSNMSLIDLIFCEGPSAAQIVKASAVKNEQMLN